LNLVNTNLIITVRSSID